MLMMKFIGKPYAGKLHVRFDEGGGGNPTALLCSVQRLNIKGLVGFG